MNCGKPDELTCPSLTRRESTSQSGPVPGGQVTGRCARAPDGAAHAPWSDNCLEPHRRTGLPLSLGLITGGDLMRRCVALITVLFSLFGMVGVPVVAYSCAESGDAGVVSYLPSSTRACYVDSCCEGGSNTPDVQIRSEVPCCDADVQIAPKNNLVLLPESKNRPAEALADTPAGSDSSRPNVRIVSTPPSTSVFHPSINPPLLI